MKPPADHTAALIRHRTLIESTLSRRIAETGPRVTLGEIKTLIFNEDAHRAFNHFVIEMTETFGADDAELLALIQDAWNFFPHRRLDGRCPAELILEQSPDLTPDDLGAGR
jgi:hypothetical protein